MRVDHVEHRPFHQMLYQQAGRDGKKETAELPFFRVFVDGLPVELGALVVSSDLQGRVLRSGERTGPLLGECLAGELELLAECKEMPPLSKVGVILAGDFYAREALDRRGGKR